MVRGEQVSEALHRLLADHEPEVVQAALRAAGVLRGRAYLYQIVASLGKPRLRASAVSALIAFGRGIAGTRGDVLNDDSLPARVRRLIPRVLREIPGQRSVDVLLPAIAHPDLAIQSSRP